MKIMYLCPKCHKKLESDGEASGHKVKCPGCGQEMVVPKRELHPGVTLGGFRLERKLGEGGMGEVFLAKQKSLDRDVALKVLPPQLCRDKELVSRFFGEVKVLARLAHPGIVTAFEAGEDGGMYFLAMAYVPGHSLQDLIDRNGAFEERAALGLIRKMAEALEYAWEDHKLLHRDIKPANVLLDAHGEPKLVDFGLARTIDQADGLTMSGTVIGTPNYMSPEQVHGEHALDFRSDLYSLGATFFHMLTGKMPYAGSSLVETLQKLMNEPLPDPRTINPRLSKGCVLLLQQMLAKKREHRHGSWRALVGGVDRVLAGHEPGGTALRADESILQMGGAPRAAAGSVLAEPPRPASGLSALATGVIVVLVAAGLGFWFMRRPAAPKPADSAQAAAPAAAAPTPARSVVKKAAPVPAAADAAALEAAALAAAREKAALEAAARAAADLAAKEAAEKEEADRAARVAAARERFAAGLGEVADQLLAGEFGRARETAAALQNEPALAALPAETAALVTRMGLASDPDAAVLRTFEGNKGETVKVEARNGSVMEVRVLGVTADKIQARQLIQGAMLDRNFGPADLSVRERLARIGANRTPEEAILRGLVLGLEKGDWNNAERAFAEAGPGLGEALVGRLQAKRDALEETAASQALAAILKTALLPADLTEPGRVMELLAAKPLSAETTEKVRAGLESFLRTYEKAAGAPVARALAAGVSGDPEIAAKLELIGLLKMAGLKTDLDHPEALIEELDSRGFGMEAPKIRAATAVFKRDHGKSESGKEAAELIQALASVQEKAPAGFAPVPPVAATEDNIKKALAALQAANSKVKAVTNVSCRIENGEIVMDTRSLEHIQDIRPLAGLPIKRLTLQKTEVRNFGALAGMPLIYLSLNNWSADKLECFPKLPELETLCMGYSSLKSLLPFRRLKIRVLEVGNTQIDKLDGIEGFPLETIVISTCPVEDIGLLAGKPLQVVRLGSSQTPLISDLSPLKDAPLKSFTLYGSRVKDLSPLAGKELNTLSLSGSPISDLKPVAGMPLMTVQLSSLEVTNLAPLKGSALQRVELQNLQVKELKPLAGCPLTYLQIKNMPKLVDAQSIPDYFPDLTDLLLHESQAKPEMIGRLAALKKLTLYTAASPDGVVVPVSSFKKP